MTFEVFTLVIGFMALVIVMNRSMMALRSDMNQLRTEMNRRFDEANTEMNRRFDMISHDVADLRERVARVEERLRDRQTQSAA